MSDDARINANDMVLETGREAKRIRASQRALVEGKYLDAPDPGMTRRADIFEQTSVFVARLYPYADDIRAMMKEQPGRVARFMGRSR